jgi:hypothetical protein
VLELGEDLFDGIEVWGRLAEVNNPKSLAARRLVDVTR